MGLWDAIGSIFTGGGGDGGIFGSGPDYGIPGSGGGIGGIGSGGRSGSLGNSLVSALVPLGVAAGAAALANLLQGKSGINTQAVDQANAARSAAYQKNFTKIPLARRGLAALPRGYVPGVQPEPPRFVVTPGTQQYQPVPPLMIPPAGTGSPAPGYASGGVPHFTMGIAPLLHISAAPGAAHEGVVRGPGTGMEDLIPARNGHQEIRLSDGEFVIPADVVSQLGDGSTEAGARKLYEMMSNIRRAKYGRDQQPKPMEKLGGGILPG